MHGILWRWLLGFGVIFWSALCLADYHQRCINEAFNLIEILEINNNVLTTKPTFSQRIPALNFWKWIAMVLSISALIFIKRSSKLVTNSNYSLSTEAVKNEVSLPQTALTTFQPSERNLQNNNLNLKKLSDLCSQQTYKESKKENCKTQSTICGVKVVQEKLKKLETTVSSLKQRINSSSSTPKQITSSPKIIKNLTISKNLPLPVKKKSTSLITLNNIQAENPSNNLKLKSESKPILQKTKEISVKPSKEKQSKSKLPLKTYSTLLSKGDNNQINPEKVTNQKVAKPKLLNNFPNLKNKKNLETGDAGRDKGLLKENNVRKNSGDNISEEDIIIDMLNKKYKNKIAEISSDSLDETEYVKINLEKPSKIISTPCVKANNERKIKPASIYTITSEPPESFKRDLMKVYEKNMKLVQDREEKLKMICSKYSHEPKVVAEKIEIENSNDVETTLKDAEEPKDKESSKISEGDYQCISDSSKSWSSTSVSCLHTNDSDVNIVLSISSSPSLHLLQNSISNKNSEISLHRHSSLNLVESYLFSTVESTYTTDDSLTFSDIFKINQLQDPNSLHTINRNANLTKNKMLTLLNWKY